MPLGCSNGRGAKADEQGKRGRPEENAAPTADAEETDLHRHINGFKQQLAELAGLPLEMVSCDLNLSWRCSDLV